MPTFTANDGISLHYQTHGSKEKSKPLILVNDLPIMHSVKINQLILLNSYTDSQALAKSSNATCPLSRNATLCSCQTFADMETPENRGLAIMSPD
jgi:hypothetical protein